MSQTLRIGTRGSALALWQAKRVQTLLAQRRGWSASLVRIRTTGDADQDAPLSQIGGKGVFVKELERALQADEIDLAVHSAKDVPSVLAAGTVLAAFPEREDPRDALIIREGQGHDLLSLPGQARIGTGSLRRQCQLLAIRPDLQIEDIRGNVDTRLRKLEEGHFDGVVLALAGLRRLERDGAVTQVLDTDIMLPAVGQGALAVQVMSGKLQQEIGAALDDPEVRLALTAERAFLARFQGDCQIPVAAHAWRQGQVLHFAAKVASLDGARVVERKRALELESPDSAAEDLDAVSRVGTAVADEILASGGEEILAEIRAAGD